MNLIRSTSGYLSGSRTVTSVLAPASALETATLAEALAEAPAKSRRVTLLEGEWLLSSSGDGLRPCAAADHYHYFPACRAAALTNLVRMTIHSTVTKELTTGRSSHFSSNVG